MQKELTRLKDYLKEYPDLEIWVISENAIMGKTYWKWIKEFIDTKKKPRIFSQRRNMIDGLNPSRALIILCGYWFLNPIVEETVFKYLLKNAKITLPIGEISR